MDIQDKKGDNNMQRCHTETISKLIESYRDENYEENVYLIKEQIYKEGIIRPLKTELSPYKEDPKIKDIVYRRYGEPGELEAYLSRRFPGYSFYITRFRYNYGMFLIDMMEELYKSTHTEHYSTQFVVDADTVTLKENWHSVVAKVREILKERKGEKYDKGNIY